MDKGMDALEVVVRILGKAVPIVLVIYYFSGSTR
jgi:hypothetical protein